MIKHLLKREPGSLRAEIITAAESRATALFWIITVCFMAAILAGTDFLRVPTWSDETHYVETVRLFVNSMTLSTLWGYREMHPPLAYILYALAGKCFGDHLWVYRLVSMMCASSAFFLLFVLMRRTFGAGAVALLSVLFFLVNPYVYGLSVFVYSDMPGLMFLLAAVAAAVYRKPAAFGFASAAAMLCRQYNVFVPAAIVVWALVTPGVSLPRERWRFCVSALLSLLPVAAIFAFWGDIAPPNGMAAWNPNREQGFHPAYIVTYCALFSVYASPAIIASAKELFSLKRVLAATAAGVIYFVFPVRPARLASEHGIDTVGFFHKAVKYITGGNAVAEQFLFYCAFVVSIVVLFGLFMSTITALRTRSRRAPYLLLFGILTCFFLGIMSCSFFVWEKYLVPVIPFFTGWILLSRQELRERREAATAAGSLK